MTDIKQKLDGLQVEQLEEIIEEAKKRKGELEKGVFYEHKIYAIRGYGDVIYKLNTIDIDNEITAFNSISESRCWANGSGKGQKMIDKCRKNKDKVHVFDNQHDFIKWCAEVEGII